MTAEMLLNTVLATDQACLVSPHISMLHDATKLLVGSSEAHDGQKVNFATNIEANALSKQMGLQIDIDDVTTQGESTGSTPKETHCTNVPEEKKRFSINLCKVDGDESQLFDTKQCNMQHTVLIPKEANPEERNIEHEAKAGSDDNELVAKQACNEVWVSPAYFQVQSRECKRPNTEDEGTDVQAIPGHWSYQDSMQVSTFNDELSTIQHTTGNVAFEPSVNCEGTFAHMSEEANDFNFQAKDWTFFTTESGDSSIRSMQIKEPENNLPDYSAEADQVCEHGREQTWHWNYQEESFTTKCAEDECSTRQEENRCSQDMFEMAENHVRRETRSDSLHMWNSWDNESTESLETEQCACWDNKWESFLAGLWSGFEGETFEVKFESRSKGTCIHWRADGESRVSQLDCDLQHNIIVWGGSYYMNFSETMHHPLVARWYGFDVKDGYIYIWHRISDGDTPASPTWPLQRNPRYTGEWVQRSWDEWYWPYVPGSRGKTYSPSWYQQMWGQGATISLSKGSARYYKGKGKHAMQAGKKASQRSMNRSQKSSKSHYVAEQNTFNYDDALQSKRVWVSTHQKEVAWSHAQEEKTEDAMVPVQTEPIIQFTAELKDGTTWRL